MGVFTMPSLGADMEAGTLVEWLVKPGDTVTRGDIIAVVETQKGAIEIEVFETGTVKRLDAEIGQKLPVGAPMAVILAEGEEMPAVSAAPQADSSPGTDASQAAPARASGRETSAVPPAATAPSQVVPSSGSLRVSPAARVAAAERGVDPAGLKGTGPGGAIVLADVEGAAAAPAPQETVADPRAEMRKAIGAAMAKSNREIPHYYLFHRVDLQAATDWLSETNAGRPPETRLLLGALFLKATALAARDAKGMNGRFENDAFRPSEAVNAGLAVAMRGGGLVTPAIRDTDSLSLDDLMQAMRDVTARVRSGRLRSSEMTMGTLTVSALGDSGVDALAGVIYPPQVALVGFGTPRFRPMVLDSRVVARQGVDISLAADHRASDGRLGARFLSRIDELLQTPEAL